MRKFTLLFLITFISVISYGQYKPCRFTVSYYMGVTDYSFTNANDTQPENPESNPYTMSGVEISYNFAHKPIGRASAGNFDAGIGVYHFSDDAIMGAYGTKLTLGYKFSTAIDAKKNLGMYARGAGQMVYTENSNVLFVPKATIGVCYKGLQLGIYGEYQDATKNSISQDIAITNSNNAYTVGVEFRFNIK